MALVRWDPFREMANLQASISKLFEEGARLAKEDGGFVQGWMFPVDIKETTGSLILKAEIPGLNREDIKISFADGRLTIRGERKKETREEGERFLRVERSYGSFSRTFTVDVPVDKDAIKARYADGILEITLPKQEEVKPREITIDVES
ncbi:MAG: Hsp20/alpha crystallin family protein [Firmicutes bacterium]|nr:Hsp20/alpha crystallin family protein [Bacillota bacterium]